MGNNKCGINGMRSRMEPGYIRPLIRLLIANISMSIPCNVVFAVCANDCVDNNKDINRKLEENTSTFIFVAMLARKFA
jgi:hypothetical protein